MDAPAAGAVHRLPWLRRLGALLLIVGTLVAVVPAPASAQVVVPSQWGLTSFCTPSQDFPQTRRFRVTNNTGTVQPATLRNQTNGQSVTFNAPLGSSFQLAPANANPASANTTQLVIQGVTVNTKAANNKACSDLVGSAVCNAAIGRYDIRWTLKNNGTGPSTITGNNRGLTFSPTTVPANGGTAVATEQVAAPTSGSTDVTITVDVDLGSSVVGNPQATVTLGQCGDPLPPTIAFTFTKTPSVSAATVGQVVTYTYAGTNTGEAALEITQLVDDRLGVLISDPTVETVVPPGGSISRDVTYTVTADDGSIGRIDNSAVVTVVPRDGPDQTPRSGVASALVVVPLVPSPEPGLAGTAVCTPATGQFTITWLLGNTGGASETVSAASRPGTFAPGTTVATGQTISATETVSAPADGATDVTLTVEFTDAPTVSATVTLGECKSPLDPAISFTFTKTPDVTRADAGQTVTYTYSGTNTGDVALEVVQLVDDRLGVLIEDTAVRTLVQPGETITRPVTYVVTADDASFGEVLNTASVTVIPDGETELLTGVAQATVAITPPLPATGFREAALAGSAAVVTAAGFVLLLISCRPGRRPVLPSYGRGASAPS